MLSTYKITIKKIILTMHVVPCFQASDERLQAYIFRRNFMFINSHIVTMWFTNAEKNLLQTNHMCLFEIHFVACRAVPVCTKAKAINACKMEGFW